MFSDYESAGIADVGFLRVNGYRRATLGMDATTRIQRHKYSNVTFSVILSLQRTARFLVGIDNQIDGRVVRTEKSILGRSRLATPDECLSAVRRPVIQEDYDDGRRTRRHDSPKR
jgi:hypothetical protein